MTDHKDSKMVGAMQVERALWKSHDERVVPSTDRPLTAGDGWIEWHEGKNPVPGQRVEVKIRWRNGKPSGGVTASENMKWKHVRKGCGDGGDIIAYRLSRPAPVSEAGEGVEPWEPVAESVCAEVIKRAEVTCRKATDELYEGLLYSVQDYLRENVMLNLSGELDRAHGYERDARAALVEIAKAAGVDFVDSRDGVERQKERILAALHPAPTDRVAELEAALREAREWHDLRADLAFDEARECSARGEKGPEADAMRAYTLHSTRLNAIDRALLSAQPREKGEG